MSVDEKKREGLRELPSVSKLLLHPTVENLVRVYSRPVVLDIIRKMLENERRRILKGDGYSFQWDRFIHRLEKRIIYSNLQGMRKIVNATGVLLHTNLGRSPLGEYITEEIREALSSYSNLEYDLFSGKRRSRSRAVEELLCLLSNASGAMVVNNNAAALLLILNSLAQGKEIVISRGELIEIGDSFRLSDIMMKSGVTFREVGASNITRKEDYEKAIDENTALILKIHKSNFKVMGFTSEVSVKELTVIAQKHSLCLVVDLGSGTFLDLSKFGIEEPPVQTILSYGPDLVCFSADKLLGGPQAGIILGKKEYVDRLKQNPILRTLRIDKLNLFTLESLIKLYLRGQEAFDKIPLLKILSHPIEDIKRKAMELYERLKRLPLDGFELILREDASPIGGGTLPLKTLPTWVISIKSSSISPKKIAQTLRLSIPPVVARIQRGEVILDLRTIFPEEFRAVEEALKGLKNARYEI